MSSARYLGIDVCEIFDRIKAGDATGTEALYARLKDGVSFLLARHIGPQAATDRVRDVFLIVVDAIRTGALQEPQGLMGLVRTAVQKQLCEPIARKGRPGRKREEVSQSSVPGSGKIDRRWMGRELAEVAAEVLKSLTVRQREVLTRFYLHEQSEEQICDEMNLTVEQFRLLRSRSKALFTELARQPVTHKWRFLRKHVA